MAAASTHQNDLLEERAGDVRVTFVAVDVLLTQLDVLGGPGQQALQSLREKLPAHLEPEPEAGSCDQPATGTTTLMCFIGKMCLTGFKTKDGSRV